MNESDHQPYRKEDTSPKDELGVGGDVSNSIIIQGDGNIIRAGDSKSPVDEEKLKQLESQAIRFELKGDLYNARRTWYEIRRIDPLFPRVDIHIDQLEKELQPKPKYIPKSSWASSLALVILLLAISIPVVFVGWRPLLGQPELTSTPPVVFPTELLVQQPSAEQYFTEEFDEGIENWTRFDVTGSANTDVDKLSLDTKGSGLIFDFNTKQLYTYLFYEPFEYENVAVEARVENRGMNDNNISLICRYNGEGWYEFNVANSGLYNFLYGYYEPDGDINYAFLVDGGSNKIKSGNDINVYKIICNDRKLSLYINGTETRVFEDNQYVLRKGKIGISASSFDQLPVIVEYDWVKISEP